MIREGWPDARNKAPECARAFYNYRDELHTEDGLVFKENHLIVPKSLRKQMLDIAHQGHIGVEGCLRRMREALFWPGMSSDLKALVQQCDACLSIRDLPPKEPMKSHEFALHSSSKVGADLCHIDNRMLLIVADYFSSFLEVSRVNNTTSTAIVRELQIIFSPRGIPDQLVTDNGPQFITPEFRSFAKTWSFEHITSSPRYAQSNGKAENAVKIVKKMFTKCKLTGESEFLALLNWNSTATEGILTSPAQILMGRRCKTIMPCMSSLLKPRYPTQQDSLVILEKMDKQAHYYNRGTRALKPIPAGEVVRLRLPGSKIWTPALCMGEVAPRSYKVKVGNRV
ncbi:uncharacterized protein K02A2.6-like [Macrobrachium nipponense]|uniref:uncharacterized protein K02A2.6-like n=1 Tax=Macrobrachium nipponense TaxID=159736 RepID=UPI0030C8501C